MASPPSLPTRSFFSPMRWVLTLLAAPAPERDGSKAHSFPFDDNRDEMQKEGIPKIVSRDEKEKEGILKIVSSGVVVSEKAAHRKPDAQEADDEEGCEHKLHTSAQDFLSKLMGRAPEGSSELLKIISSGVVVSENAAHREPDAREADEEEGSEDNHHSLVLEDWGARIYGWLHWYCSIEFALKGLFKPIHRPPLLDTGASFHAGDDMDSSHHVILDSGASMHATGNPLLFSEFTRAPAGSAAAVYHTRDGRDLGIAGAGIIARDKFHLNDVHYVPELGTRFTLVSVRQLAGCDYLVMFCGGSCYVKKSNGSLVGRGRMHDEDGFYHLEFLGIPLVATDGAN